MQKRKKDSNIHFDTTLCSEDKKRPRKTRNVKEEETLEYPFGYYSVFRRQEMQEKDKKRKRERKAPKPISTPLSVQKTRNAGEERQKKTKLLGTRCSQSSETNLVVNWPHDVVTQKFELPSNSEESTVATVWSHFEARHVAEPRAPSSTSPNVIFAFHPCVWEKYSPGDPSTFPGQIGRKH